MYDSYQALNKLGMNNIEYGYDLDARYLIHQTKGDKFCEDLCYIAERYFTDPSYLRVDGNPLIFIYLMRDFRNFCPYLELVQKRMAEMGCHPILIADVMELPLHELGLMGSIKLNLSGFLRSPLRRATGLFRKYVTRSQRMDWDLLSQYIGGITGYNLHYNYPMSDFLARVENAYRGFRRKSNEYNLRLIPTVMLGLRCRALSRKEPNSAGPAKRLFLPPLLGSCRKVRGSKLPDNGHHQFQRMARGNGDRAIAGVWSGVFGIDKRSGGELLVKTYRRKVKSNSVVASCGQSAS